MSPNLSNAGRERGHRAIPHTADVILEAWGGDLAACLEEAFAALVEVYAEVGSMTEADRRRLHLDNNTNDTALLHLLDELIFLLDTSVTVPVRAEVKPSDREGLDVEIVLVERSSVEAVGSVPKAVSHSELLVESSPGMVRCRFLVDV